MHINIVILVEVSGWDFVFVWKVLIFFGGFSKVEIHSVLLKCILNDWHLLSCACGLKYMTLNSLLVTEVMQCVLLFMHWRIRKPAYLCPTQYPNERCG
jgi:hypothetical protein